MKGISKRERIIWMVITRYFWVLSSWSHFAADDSGAGTHIRGPEGARQFQEHYTYVKDYYADQERPQRAISWTARWTAVQGPGRSVFRISHG